MSRENQAIRIRIHHTVEARTSPGSQTKTTPTDKKAAVAFHLKASVVSVPSARRREQYKGLATRDWCAARCDVGRESRTLQSAAYLRPSSLNGLKPLPRTVKPSWPSLNISRKMQEIGARSLREESRHVANAEEKLED